MIRGGGIVRQSQKVSGPRTLRSCRMRLQGLQRHAPRRDGGHHRQVGRAGSGHQVRLRRRRGDGVGADDGEPGAGVLPGERGHVPGPALGIRGGSGVRDGWAQPSRSEGGIDFGRRCPLVPGASGPRERAAALAHARRQKVCRGAFAMPFTGLRRHSMGRYVTFIPAPSDKIVSI